MHIGIDLDNTIIDYRRVFPFGLKEIGFQISKETADKEEIAALLLKKPDGNKQWTLLQGLVYGKYIMKAKPARGVKEFISKCRKAGIPVSIISHRTRYPAIGPKIDLHKTAFEWLVKNGFFSKQHLNTSSVFFEETKYDKVKRIEKQGCTHFIDDKIDILDHPDFPLNTKRIKYDTETSFDQILQQIIS